MSYDEKTGALTVQAYQSEGEGRRVIGMVREHTLATDIYAA